MEIEIGKKYITVNCCISENNGITVTVIGYAGPAGFEGMDKHNTVGDRYFVDKEFISSLGDFVNHLGVKQLKKIDDDDSRKVVSWEELEDIWTPEKIGEPT